MQRKKFNKLSLLKRGDTCWYLCPQILKLCLSKCAILLKRHDIFIIKLKNLSMKILAICGSLRKTSTNHSILKAAKKFYALHEWTELNLEDLPYFDPDNQFSKKLPEAVTKARTAASQSDLIFVSTPEYAHGMPGLLKNGFEWIFHEGTQRKKVALVIGASQGEFAQANIIEVLKTMDFDISLESSTIIKGVRAKVKEDGTFVNDVDLQRFHEFCGKFL